MMKDRMAIFSSRSSLGAMFLLLATVVSAGARAVPAPAAHRAVYDLALERASDRSGIASVSGRLVLEINGSACEVFAITSRIVTRFATNEGKVNVTDIRSSSWESGDGKSFRFGTRQYLNSTLGEETRGRAVRGDGDKPGSAFLTAPADEQFGLPPEVVFPSEHNKRIMEAAFTGKNIDNSVVYDGSDGKKIYNVTTFIGRERAPGKSDLSEAGEIARPLGRLRAWPVTVSFFEDAQPAGGEQTPSHEVSFTMFENGVSAKLLLDYGDFAIRGVLADLKIFDVPACP